MEQSPAVTDVGIKATRLVVVRVALSLVAAILTIEFASLAYLIYTLGLYLGSRWLQLLLAEAIVVPFVVGIMVFFCVRWSRGTIEFGRVLESGEEPTQLQTENCVRSVFTFARNAGILFVFIYSLATLFIVLFLYKYFGYSTIEITSIGIFKFVTGLNLGVVLFYAVKIIEQFRIDQAVGRLFEKGVYEWPHFKMKIRYKIFMLIFTVVAYLLCSAVLMGYTQSQNAQMAQLKENLDYWIQELPKHAADLKGEEGTTGNPNLLSGNQLGAHAQMVILSKDGSIIRGESSTLSPEEIKSISSEKSAGEITDYAKRKLIMYSPQPEHNLTVVAMGHWGVGSSIQTKTRNVVIALFLATILLSIVATYLLVTDINTPLRKILEFLRTISSGATGAYLKAYSEDEMGDFARELARTTALLEEKTDRASELLQRIEDVAVTIEENAARVQVATEEQAGGVSEQAGAVEEALSTSEEIVATAREIADSAADVQKSAEENLLSCRLGSDRVTEALEGFKSLGKHVEEISSGVLALGEDIRQITGVMHIIEEVAIQINLLSLNAQIEAASAGEEGERFGVVAEEVRRLADNTMDAVKRISVLVDSTLEASESAVESAKKGSGLVGKGAELADAVGQTLTEIERQADSTETAARKITITTKQQRTSSEQMAETISDIHTTAQQIKANTEHVLEAMETLSETSGKLTLEFLENR